MNKLLFLIIALFSVIAQCQNSERPNKQSQKRNKWFDRSNRAA